ncbi:hypothetical protein J1N35_001152, partial [Gossypium stocksii]
WDQQFKPFLNGVKPNSPNSEIHSHYEDNWVYLFSNGAVARASRNASVGGVVCDRVDNWILGFNHYLGRCSPLEAELWGIFDGILILLHKGYKKVRIQIDNFEVVRALSMEESVDFGITLLRRVKRLLHSKGQWKIKYAPKKCNLIVDQLTFLQIFEVPLDLMVRAIQ